jgi:hypothetical protein
MLWITEGMCLRLSGANVSSRGAVELKGKGSVGMAEVTPISSKMVAPSVIVALIRVQLSQHTRKFQRPKLACP